MKLKTFRKGGIHPPENKFAKSIPISEFPIVREVVIPLSQNIGSPSKPIVNKGDFVKTGQLIAEASGFVSANIHSSVTGKVTKIDEYISQSGYKTTSIFISTEEDQWVETADLSPDIINTTDLDAGAINHKIQQMGIVGLGGATFPTNVKFAIPKDKKVTTLIINGAECEPYLTADHRLMFEHPEEVIIGATVIMKAIGVDECYIGIENNKLGAIEAIQKIAQKYKGIQVVPLKVKYPQGAEKQLIKSITGKEVPSGKLPFEVGCVVSNVGTTYAIYQAVMKNIPLIKRIVTVASKSLDKSYNFTIRIGTPINDIITHIGGLPNNTYKVVSGGPMMGKAVFSTEAVVAKGTSGILFLNEKDSARKTEVNCIRCAKCVRACPMGLEPYLLEKLAIVKNWELAENNDIMDCVECGSCQFVCPAHRPLLDYIRVGKNTVGKIIRNRKN
ncbi:MAG: electron transport complex subunit RsxC [Lentimicrobiaceae bacterium]|nr:electron transport complex subunit RsxC [Lentimicrobiaceae bacterium]